MKKVIITGANGYIGCHVINELLKHKEEFDILALGRNNSNLSNDVKFKKIDILNLTEEENLDFMKNVDICIHLAWSNGFDHNNPSHMEELSGHFSFIKKLADNGTKHFAVAGSFREYGSIDGMADETKSVDPDNLYCLSKLSLKKALEIYFKGKDICLQWIRPFTVYGDDEMNNSLMSKILLWNKEGKKEFPFTDGKEEYDYIHVTTLARQIVAIISQTEIVGIIDCCSGKPTNIAEMIEKFIKENHLSIRPKYGAFQTRKYDSPVIYGNNSKINKIMKNLKS